MRWLWPLEQKVLRWIWVYLDLERPLLQSICLNGSLATISLTDHWWLSMSSPSFIDGYVILIITVHSLNVISHHIISWWPLLIKSFSSRYVVFRLNLFLNRAGGWENLNLIHYKNWDNTKDQNSLKCYQYPPPSPFIYNTIYMRTCYSHTGFNGSVIQHPMSIEKSHICMYHWAERWTECRQTKCVVGRGRKILEFGHENKTTLSLRRKRDIYVKVRGRVILKCRR